MTQLRDSQVETLRLVDRFEAGKGGVRPWRLVSELGITEQSARARLERLRESGHLYPLLDLAANGHYVRAAFRLTQLGREALEGRES